MITGILKSLSYTVKLTKYGPGGSYDPKTGTVTMLTTKGGQFKKLDPVETIVHEVVHMGIENEIVARYKLSHPEKERLVDLFVQKLYKEEMPNYKLQNLGESKIDPFINDLSKLPEEVAAYKKSNALSANS